MSAGETRRGVLVLVCGILALSGFVVMLGRVLQPEDPGDKGPLEEPVPIRFQITDFQSLDGWASDDLAGVVSAFLRSCEPPDGVSDMSAWAARPFGGGSHKLASGQPVAGRRADWQDVCRQMAALPQNTADIRAFFEASFTPVSVLDEGKSEGLFTGYYEPEMTGSTSARGPAAVPLLEKPDDLISIDLGDFRDDLKGKRLAGRVENGALKPYEDRGAIEAGGLGPRGKPLVWIDDPVDAFFLHIQGSGRVMLDTGEMLRVGYAGQNGHPYVAIGKVLLERGAMTRDEISMQAIRAWLTLNRDEAADVMKVNTSYVFFHRLDVTDPNLGPLGAGGTNLTPWRSLAVDRAFHALGVPIWLDTTLPPDAADVADTGALVPLQRLMVAQDTGGAIRGPVRGDVFFGWGEEATDLAGRMKQRGAMTLLLPNPLAARLAEEASAP